MTITSTVTPISYMSTTTHNNVTQVSHTPHREEEVVTHTFSSIEDVIHTIKQQANVFLAIGLVNEINELNNCSIITDYHIREIKKHYRESKIEDLNIENLKSKIEKVKYENPEMRFDKRANPVSKCRNGKNRYHELQKAYMKLLSR